MNIDGRSLQCQCLVKAVIFYGGKKFIELTVCERERMCTHTHSVSFSGPFAHACVRTGVCFLFLLIFTRESWRERVFYNTLQCTHTHTHTVCVY